MTIWQTSGVGSLPFVDSAEAIEYVCSTYTIPFYPQLVKHERFSKSSLPQMLQEAVPLPILNQFSSKSGLIKTPAQLSAMWEMEIPQHIASLPGSRDFVEALSKSGSSFFKLQLIGTKTAIHLLETLCEQKLDNNIKDVITANLKKYAELFLSQCHSRNKKPILIIDEPFGPDADILNTFKIENTIGGMHCCGTFALTNHVQQFKHAYLSFDINQHALSHSFFKTIEKLLGLGGVMLGIVDTTKKDIDIAACKRVWEQLNHQISFNTLSTDALPPIITGGCGTGMQSSAFEKQLSTLLNDLNE